MTTDRSLEADMLYAIGYFSPIEFHTLRRYLEEWRNESIEWDRYEEARANLVELDLIVPPSVGDRQHRITAEGFKALEKHTEKAATEKQTG